MKRRCKESFFIISPNVFKVRTISETSPKIYPWSCCSISLGVSLNDFWGIGSLESTNKALEQPKSLGFMTFGRLISVPTRTTQVVYLDAVLSAIRLSSPVVRPSLCPHVECPHDWWFIFSRCRIINIHFYCDSWTRPCVISWLANGGANKWVGFFTIYGRRHTFRYARTLAHLSEGPSAI